MIAVREFGKERGGINKREIGGKYEQIAAHYLTGKGYQIVMCNYRNRYGEIDIIAKQEDVLVFCEVKYRSSNSCGEPSEAVSESKQKKICRAAFLYYAQNGFANEAPCRFDVLAVYGNGNIVHYTNAFEFRT